LKIVKFLTLSFTSSVLLISETCQLKNGLSFGDINLITPQKQKKNSQLDLFMIRDSIEKIRKKRAQITMR